MSLLSDPEVVQFRGDYYRLLVRLLASEPDQAMLDGLREGLDERTVAASQVHPLIGEGWRTMGEQLAAAQLAQLEQEYTRLFLGPYGDMVNPYESWYVTGRLYAEPLAEVRGFMGWQGLETANDSRREPEDSIGFELGIMARLVERQQGGGDAAPESLIEPQREFLGRHLLMWGPTCAQEIEDKPAAAFYRGAAQVLRGFLEVERDFFTEDGGIEVQTLEEARRKYPEQAFRGNVVDRDGFPPAEGSEDP